MTQAANLAALGSNTNTTGILPAAGGGTGTSVGYNNFKNRIINGAMVIDQRNAGASVTATSNPYTLDRWQAIVTQSSKFTIQQNAGSVTPPAGFTNYLGVTSSSSYSVLTGDTFLMSQTIEGFNIADLNWGSANAKTVTFSFWVRSSLTGTFGGALSNYAGTRSYPFSYTISSANTWEQKSVTIAGDTSGSWSSNNDGGVSVRFGLGSGSTFSGTAGAWAAGNIVQPTGSVSVVGTNGATWYITGVQLEVGSSATTFDVRSYGTELALAQRYYSKSYAIGTVPGTASTTAGSFGTSAIGSYNGCSTMTITYPVEMRTTPTWTAYSPKDGAAGFGTDAGLGANYAVNGITGGTRGGYISFQSSAGGSTQTIVQWTAVAEL